jgi:hypothetical protein
MVRLSLTGRSIPARGQEGFTGTRICAEKPGKERVPNSESKDKSQNSSSKLQINIKLQLPMTKTSFEF